MLRIDLDKALKQFKIEDLTKLSTEKNQKKLPKISSPNKHFPGNGTEMYNDKYFKPKL